MKVWQIVWSCGLSQSMDNNHSIESYVKFKTKISNLTLFRSVTVEVSFNYNKLIISFVFQLMDLTSRAFLYLQKSGIRNIEFPINTYGHKIFLPLATSCISMS